MPTIGQQLKEARERRPATISQAAEATRIKFSQIEAMERDDFSRMGAAIYAKGFLKLYSEYLGLDPAPLIREYVARSAPPVEKPVLTAETAPRVFRKKPPPPELAPPTELPFDSPDGLPETPQAPRPVLSQGSPARGPGFRLNPEVVRMAVPAAVALGAVVVLVLLILWIVRACSGPSTPSAAPRAAEPVRAAPAVQPAPAAPAPAAVRPVAPPAAPAVPAAAPAAPRRNPGPPLLIGDPPAPYIEFNTAPAPAPVPAPAAPPTRTRRP